MLRSPGSTNRRRQDQPRVEPRHEPRRSAILSVCPLNCTSLHFFSPQPPTAREKIIVVDMEAAHAAAADPVKPTSPVTIPTPAASSEIEPADGTDDDEDEFSVTEDYDAWSSGSTSATSSIYAQSYEHGRRYQCFKNGRYPIPNDDTEQSREDMKHAMMLELTDGKLFYAPVGDNPQHILDIGTGTGKWETRYSVFRTYNRLDGYEQYWLTSSTATYNRHLGYRWLVISCLPSPTPMCRSAVNNSSYQSVTDIRALVCAASICLQSSPAGYPQTSTS